MNVFTRTLSDDLASLVKEIDGAVGENEDQELSAFVVYLTDDPDAAEEELKAFAEANGIENVPLTVFDGIAGPPSYKVAEEAEVTVMLWRGQRVRVNHAFASGDLNEDSVQQVVNSASEILD